MDLPKAIKFKRVSKNIVKTRHAVAEEFMEEEDDDNFLPDKFYVIRADTRDFSKGFCVAKCIKAEADFFIGQYLVKVSEDTTKVFYKLSKEKAKFYSESVFSTIISLVTVSPGDFALDKFEISNIISSVNSFL